LVLENIEGVGHPTSRFRTFQVPGGNATGITIFGGSAVTKRLQLLHEIVPKAGTTAYLMNPSNPNAESEMRAAQSAATLLGQQIIVVGWNCPRGAECDPQGRLNRDRSLRTSVTSRAIAATEPRRLRKKSYRSPGVLGMSGGAERVP
jgi:hypothetical protein